MVSVVQILSIFMLCYDLQCVHGTGHVAATQKGVFIWQSVWWRLRGGQKEDNLSMWEDSVALDYTMPG